MDAQKGSKLLAVGRWMMVGGLALALVGGVFWVREYVSNSRLAHADSVVSELEARVGGADQAILYYPHLRFRLPDGSVKDATGKVGANPANFAPGDAVRLVYSPANPADVTVATTWAVYGVAITLGIVGLGGFDLGVVAWWWGRRRAFARGRRGGGQKKQFEALFGRAGGYRSGESREG